MNINGKTRVLSVIGHPIEHTFSPLIHNLLIQELGHNNVYVPFHVLPNNLDDALKGIRALKIKGVNVTVPHKEVIIDKIDFVDEIARQIGAVNTLKVENEIIKGYNTDYYGLYQSLVVNNVTLEDKASVIIGAGGAARSAAMLCVALKSSKIYIANRTFEKAQKLVDDIKQFYNVDIVAINLDELQNIKEDIICFQTTPVGMYPNTEYSPIEDKPFYEKIKVAVDLIYNPGVTKFLKLAKESGALTINGFEMLFYQAIKAYEIWENIQVPQEIVFKIKTKVKNKIIPSKNVVLIGFMGCGKSTIGKYLSKKIEFDYLDVDKFIEEKHDHTINYIFNKYGEKYFRKIESEAIHEISTNNNSVISTGGGVVKNQSNIDDLNQNGIIVYLKASVKQIIENIGDDLNRPLLQTENKHETITKLLEQRKDLYEKAAKVIVNVDGKSINEIVEEIDRKIEVYL